jgi:adenylate cyclase
VRGFKTSEEEWKAFLEGTHPVIRKGHRVLGHLPSGPHCKLCGAPFGAPAGALFRRYGFTPWEKNPNICMRCLVGLERKDVSGAEVEATFLFADVRRSSDLARQLGTMEFTRLMQRFYALANRILIRNEALLDKFVGDEVVGLFLPFMTGDGHATQAIRSAEELLEETGHGDPDGPWLPIGAGIHSGQAFVGLVSRGGSSDFTALGDAPNIAAHLAAQAKVGEILVTEAAQEKASIGDEALERRHLSLKGHPVDAVVIPAGSRTAERAS